MHQVYSGALCNISGTGFKDGSRSLFHSSIHEITNVVEVKLGDGLSYEDFDPVGPGTFHLIDYNLVDVNIGQAPLLSRGWVLQERLLSKCIMHFTGGELFWECGELLAAQTFPQGVCQQLDKSALVDKLVFNPAATKVSSLNKHSTSQLNSNCPGHLAPASWSLLKMSEAHETVETETDRDADGPAAMIGNWGLIVRSYTTMKLTEPDDKLVAIAGVARLFQPRIQSAYLAGLWQRDLLFQLLWYKEEINAVKAPELICYRAPSWSWASLNEPVVQPSKLVSTWREDEPRIFSQVLEAVVVPKGHDEFGEIRSGYLRLRGPLIVVEYRPSAPFELTSSHHRDRVNNLFMMLDDPLIFTKSGSQEHQYIPRIVVDCCGKTWDDGHISFLVPLRMQDDADYMQDLSDEAIGKDSEFGRSELTGLILAPTTTKGEYRRVGVFESSDESDFVKFQIATRNIPSCLYEDYDGDNQYTMKII